MGRRDVVRSISVKLVPANQLSWDPKSLLALNLVPASCVFVRSHAAEAVALFLGSLQ